MKSHHRKVGHEPTGVGAWKAGRRRRAGRGGAWRAVFRRGFLLHVDGPRVPRNQRFPVGEELVRKSHRRRGDLTAEGSGRRIK